jgi:Uma2 family endonuclease
LVRGPADLVIEVISPESEWRDRYDKFQEYAAGGVQEYWLIDPEQELAEFYVLDAEHQYQKQSLDVEGRYWSRMLPNFWIKPEWLWRNSLPVSALILKTVVGPAYETYMLKLLQGPEKL